jgi:hypothetical protein
MLMTASQGARSIVSKQTFEPWYSLKSESVECGGDFENLHQPILRFLIIVIALATGKDTGKTDLPNYKSNNYVNEL